jgi:hydroxymethylbilane synthase
MKRQPRKLVLGTRGSKLAMLQAEFVRRELQAIGAANIEIKIIKTRGDRETSLPFEKMAGQGFFTKEIERALLTGEIDLAVHSCKDLETTQPDGLFIAAVPQRIDRRDMMLIRIASVDESRPWGLKKSAVVGGSSARRIAQVLYCRPDLQIKPLRGNVPTRVEKLKLGEYDAIILAVAGVQRLGLNLDGLRRVDLAESIFVPAPAQGALAVETRTGDDEINSLVQQIDDPDLRATIEAERRVIRLIGGGCQLPVGICGTHRDHGFALSAFLGSGHGDRRSTPRRVSVTARTPDEAVDIVVMTLTRSTATITSSKFHGRQFVITRALDQAIALRRSVDTAGGKLVCFPTLEVIEAGDPELQKRTLSTLGHFDWLLFSSSNGVRMFFKLLKKLGFTNDLVNHIAVMGPGTSAAFRQLAGRPVDFVPTVSTGEGFAEEFAKQHGKAGARLLFPTTAERRGALERLLAKAGFGVETLIVYNTVRPEKAPAWDGRADAVIFTSPKAARHFLELAKLPPGAGIISIGPATTDYLAERRLLPVYEAVTHDMDGILEVLNVHFG